MEGIVFLIPILGTIGFFGAIITWVYMHYKSKHQQRMALIDSGQNAEIFFEKKYGDHSNSLKYGMLLTGIGVGFFIGLLVESALNWPEGLAVFPISIIGGGVSLILFYFIISKRNEDD